MSTLFNTDDDTSNNPHTKLTSLASILSTTSSSFHEDDQYRPRDINTNSLNDFLTTENTIFQPTTETDMIKSIVMCQENPMEKSSLFRSLIEHTEPKVNAKELTEHFSSSEQEQKLSKFNQIEEHLLRPFSECVEQYYRILFRVCECTEELKQELRQVKSERDQMSEDLINAENAYTDVKKRNEKLKLIINEHKMNTETLKRFSEESVRYTEEQKQKYAVLKQHAQEKLNEANSEIERLRKTHTSEMEGVQTQLRYAQLRVQSLEQEIKSVKQELEQKKKENIELTNICDELLATNKRYRLNTLFAFTLTVLAVLTAGVFVSTYFEQYHETVGISVNKPIVKHMTDFQANRKKNDLGIVQLNMDMNLNPLFDWNVKQLFLYLIAEYVTPANSLNQVILWDKIIRRGENANINIRDLATKYYFWDDGEHLRSNNVTLTLAWNIISNAGRLIHVRADGAHSFIFPDQYTTSRVANSKTSGQE
ncbi:unnamed protein product [Adineta steineri]|uniref:Signal peptidase complex subunit 3 n=1 Tax=Adineta steineri TaxID=433720 RepID=A0A818FHV2_9BILA|nr:unnamed protein product [Adineta steineri]CAF3475863.1 unnamed protein product [Adineta steineri]